MELLKGTILVSGIVPTSSEDTYETHTDTYGKGGHRGVNTLLERDAIPPKRRGKGMTVYVAETDVTYMLKGGLTNNDWTDDKEENNEILELLETKVDKEIGKQLSQENFTTDLLNKLSNLDNNFKGYHPSLAVVLAKVPNPKDGFYVMIPNSENKTIIWFYDGTEWIDTNSSSLGDMLKSIYDPQNRNLDVYNMDSMVETLNNKIFTAIERTKLKNIEDGAQKNTVHKVNNKTGNVILDKNDIGLDKVDNTSDDEKIVKEARRTTGKLTINGIVYDGSMDEEIEISGGSGGGSSDFATSSEVNDGIVNDKAVSPLTLKANNYNKKEVDKKINDITSGPVYAGYNVEVAKFLSSFTGSGQPANSLLNFTSGLKVNNTSIEIVNATTIKLKAGNKYKIDAQIPIVSPNPASSSNVINANIILNKDNTTTNDNTISPMVNTTMYFNTAGNGVNNVRNLMINEMVDLTNIEDDIYVKFIVTSSTLSSSTAFNFILHIEEYTKDKVILNGLSELPNPKVNVETLTPERHPLTKKRLWTITIDCGFFGNGVLKAVPVNFENYDIEDVILDGSLSYIKRDDAVAKVILPLIQLGAASTSFMSVSVQRPNINLFCTVDRTMYSAIAVLKYTKISDTVDDPVALVGNIDNGAVKIDFATQEEVTDGKVTDKAIAPNTFKTELDKKINNLVYPNVFEGQGELPSFQLGTEVRTSERWTDGRPIWKKTISFGALPNNTTKLVAHEITGFKDIWVDNANTFCSNANFSSGLPRANPTNNLTIDLNLTDNRNSLRIITGTNQSDVIGVVTIRFTKTDENNLSPVAKVGFLLEGLSELPSTELNVEKRTSERHPITKKPYYKMMVYWGNMPNNTSAFKLLSSLGIPIDKIDFINVVLDESYRVTSSGVTPIQSAYSTFQTICYTRTDRNEMQVSTSYDATAQLAYVTVIYTKKLDTSDSPVALIGGGGVTEFSTQEEVDNGIINNKAISPLTLKVHEDNKFYNKIETYTKTEVNNRIDSIIYPEIKNRRVEIPSPELNVEKLTTHRHPVTKKRLWTIALNIGTFPDSSGTKAVAIPNSSIMEDILIDYNMSYSKDSTGLTIALNQVRTSTNNETGVMLKNKEIMLDVRANRSMYNITIVLMYTKIADTISDPTTTVGVTLEGLSEIPSSELGVEKLTPYRHPVTKKRLWSRTIDCGACPSAKGIKDTLIPDISNIDFCKIDSQFTYLTSPNPPTNGNVFSLLMTRPSLTIGTATMYDVNVYTSDNHIRIESGTDRSMYNLIATILYTKKTDSVDEPAALVGSTRRGLPGPKGQDGTVTFNDLTEAQKEELTRNKYIRTRESSNLLYYNKNNESAYLDVMPSQNLRLTDIVVKTKEDNEYTVPVTQVITEPSNIGEYRFLNIDYDTDIFKDNSCIAFFPFAKDFLSKDKKYAFVNKSTGLAPNIVPADFTVFNKNKKAMNNSSQPLWCPELVSLLPTRVTDYAFSIFIKSADVTTTGVIFYIKSFELCFFNKKLTILDRSKSSNNYRQINFDHAVNTWYHIVVNVSNAHTDSNVFVNASLKSYGTLSTTSRQIDTDMVGLNIDSFTKGEYVTGTISSDFFGLRMFNRHLTQDNVDTLYTVDREALELFHGSGEELKEAKVVSTTINLPVPKAPNEAGAIKLGLQKDDLYINSSNGLSIVTTNS